MTVDVTFETIAADEYFARFPDAVKAALPLALNYAARDARKIGAARMTKEINFPKGYLDLPDRFVAYPTANADNLVVRVVGRGRGTSLYRFAEGDPTPEATRIRGAGGIRVQVKPGKSIVMPEAFVMRLRAGPSLTDDNFNLGVAIRVKKGQIPQIAKSSGLDDIVEKGGLLILYGPSVAQAFRVITKDDTSGVYTDEVTSNFAAELKRLFIVQLGR